MIPIVEILEAGQIRDVIDEQDNLGRTSTGLEHRRSLPIDSYVGSEYVLVQHGTAERLSTDVIDSQRDIVRSLNAEHSERAVATPSVFAYELK